MAFGYLHVMPDPCAGVDPSVHCNPWGLISEGPPVDPAGGVPLGPIALEESPHPGRGLRASLTFRIPLDVAPGSYHILACGEPCVAGARAYRAWPSPLYIGVDPPSGEPRVHHWPLDDPAIDLLAGDALLLGPDGKEVTAAEVRAEAADDLDQSERVETAAASTDEARDHRPLTVWIVAAALALAAGWVAVRLGRPRKRIRPGP